MENKKGVWACGSQVMHLGLVHHVMHYTSQCLLLIWALKSYLIIFEWGILCAVNNRISWAASFVTSYSNTPTALKEKQIWCSLPGLCRYMNSVLNWSLIWALVLKSAVKVPTNIALPSAVQPQAPNPFEGNDIPRWYVVIFHFDPVMVQLVYSKLLNSNLMGAQKKLELTKMQGNRSCPIPTKPESNCPTSANFRKRSTKIKTSGFPLNLVESDAHHRALRKCAAFGSSPKLAKFHCIGSFLVLREYWNFWLLVDIVENRRRSLWSELIFRPFSEDAHDYSVRKVGFTTLTQVLRGTLAREPLGDDHGKLCIQLFTAQSRWHDPNYFQVTAKMACLKCTKIGRIRRLE